MSAPVDDSMPPAASNPSLSADSPPHSPGQHGSFDANSWGPTETPIASPGAADVPAGSINSASAPHPSAQPAAAAPQASADPFAAPAVEVNQPVTFASNAAPSSMGLPWENDDADQPAAAASQSQQGQPVSPTDDFFNGSTSNVQPSSPTSSAAVQSPTVQDTSALDALNKQIASRTAAADAATKAKEAQITEAAQQYLKSQQEKHSARVATVKKDNRKAQQDEEQKLATYKKSGAVWNSVGMLVDLKKPNAYSKETERMRALLNTLRERSN